MGLRSGLCPRGCFDGCASHVEATFRSRFHPQRHVGPQVVSNLMTTAFPVSAQEQSEPRRPDLALVLTPLGRNRSPLPNFYWTPLFAALNAARISLLVLQPHRTVISVPRVGRRHRRPATRVPLVSPIFLISLIRARPKFILSTEYGPHTFLALLAARLIGSQGLIFKEHADCAGLSSHRLLYRKLLTSLAQGTVVNTDAARRDVESLLGADPARVHQVPLLVPPMTNQLTQADPSLALTGARPVFLFVGRLVEQKNVSALLEASSLLRREGLSFSVWIVGDGPCSSALAQQARDLGLGDTANFAGPVPYDAIGHFYAFSDVFVMPSFRDYRSVAVLEAMRFGKPIIDSSNDGNSGDSVLSSVNGFVFDPTDVRGLAWAMRQFIEQPGLTKEMGTRSAEFMADRTPTSSAEALGSVLLQIAPRFALSSQAETEVEPHE